MFKLNRGLLVACRVRPIEYDQGMLFIEDDDTTITIKDINKKMNIDQQQYQFHKTFDQSSSQLQVYNKIEEHCLKDFMKGKNCCFISYGQTTSGKTFTVFGEAQLSNTSDPDNPEESSQILNSDKRGQVIHVMEYLLRRKNELKKSKRLVISCSFFEIYLNEVRDIGRKFVV